MYATCYRSKKANPDFFEDMVGYSKVNSRWRAYKKEVTMLDITPWLFEPSPSEIYSDDFAANLVTIEQARKSAPPCVHGEALINYLNREDVRRALHIPDALASWTMCTRIRYARKGNDMPDGSPKAGS